MIRRFLFILLIILSIPVFLETGSFSALAQTKTSQVRKRSRNIPKQNSPKKGSEKKHSPKNSQDAKRQQEATQREIKKTEEELRANETKVRKELAELGKVEGEISEIQSRIKRTKKKLSDLNETIRALEESISKNEKDLNKLRDEYLKAVKKMRVTRKNKSDIAFIFSSSSFNQAIRRMRYLKEFSEWKNRQSDEITSKVKLLKEERISLDATRREEQNNIAIQKVSQEKLEIQKKKQESLVAVLKENGAALQRHLQKKQVESNELGNLVRQLIAKEREEQRQEDEKRRLEETRRMEEQKQKETQERLLTYNKSDSKEKKEEIKSTAKKDTKAASGEYANARKRTPRSKNNEVLFQKEGDSFLNMKGKLPNPVTGQFSITSRFGRQSLQDLPDVEYDNPGIDAEVEMGASAIAVYNGNVSGVYLLPGYNTVVILNHGGYYTVYGNISSPSVKVGDSVTTGQKLGILAANEDNPDSGAIHFEVWRNREKQNPQEWLR